MRVMLAAMLCMAILLALPAAAAPVAPKAGSLAVAAAPPIVMVAGGCGPGWHRRHWRDQWGRWHWGRCIHNW